MLNDAIYLLATIWFSCSNIPCGTKTRKCLYQLHFIPKKVLFWIILANIACYNYSIQSHQKFHNLSLGKLHYRIYLNTLWNILWLFDVLPLAIYFIRFYQPFSVPWMIRYHLEKSTLSFNSIEGSNLDRFRSNCQIQITTIQQQITW